MPTPSRTHNTHPLPIALPCLSVPPYSFPPPKNVFTPFSSRSFSTLLAHPQNERMALLVLVRFFSSLLARSVFVFSSDKKVQARLGKMMTTSREWKWNHLFYCIRSSIVHAVNTKTTDRQGEKHTQLVLVF